MLKTFEECPKKYEFIYVDKVSLPKNKYFFEKGKNIHSLANYFIKGFDVNKLEQALTSQELSLWNYLKSTEYFKYQLLKSEYQISIKLGENWIGGRLDALIQNNNDYYILDYKTGSIPKNPEYDYQTMIYLLCVDKLIDSYDSLNFVYLNLKENSNFVINFNSNLKNEYKIRISNTLAKINKYFDINKTIQKNECNCEYKKFCNTSV